MAQSEHLGVRLSGEADHTPDVVRRATAVAQMTKRDGPVALGETLAAAVVAVMYSGGTFLESFAEGRARREMRDLLSRVPRTATRHRNGGLEDVALDDIRPGDRLLVDMTTGVSRVESESGKVQGLFIQSQGGQSGKGGCGTPAAPGTAPAAPSPLQLLPGSKSK